MKTARYFGFLTVCALLSLLALTVGSSATLAAESLNISHDNGAIGDKIQVTGSGFSSGDKVYIYFAHEELDVDDDIDDIDAWEQVETMYATLSLENGGDITGSFLVPRELTDGDKTEAVSAGDYFIYATERKEGRILAMEEFTVTGIMVDPAKGPTGTEVEVEGVGFDRDENIEVLFSVHRLLIASGDDETDRDGEFKLTIIIPETPAGDYTIIVQTDEDEAQAEFTVEPESTISARTGIMGDRVSISGTGFGSSVDVTVTFGTDKIATSQTDNEGNLDVSFDVPPVRAGTYDVEVRDEYGNSGTFEFTLSTNISISPVTSQASPGYVGMEATLYGIGFRPSSMITITYTSTATIFSTTSEKDGSFSYSFGIPKGKPGENIISVTDGVNQLQLSFFMELLAPATPNLMLPAIKTQPGRPVTFDWKEVTDPSGVTYVLQVARDRGFTDLVIERYGLVESQYTMSQTEDELLDSTKKTAECWWRVKAVDGAGNESAWASARSFDTGVAPVTADWWKYLLIGLGVLILLGITFFVGRRFGLAR